MESPEQTTHQRHPRTPTPRGVLGWVSRLVDYVGSTDFFRTPLSFFYLVIGVLNLAAPLYLGYDLLKGESLNVGLLDLPAKMAIVVTLYWIILLVAGWISFELWRSRVKRLPTAADDQDEFAATPLYAHLVRTSGEWLGLWVATVGFLGGGLMQLAMLTDMMERRDAEALMSALGLPSPGLALAIGAPIVGYLLVFSTRALAETISALTAVANNTRRS